MQQLIVVMLYVPFVRCLFSSWFRKLRQVRQKGRASLPHIEAVQMAKFASTEMTSLY